MLYNMTKEVKEISELKGITLEDAFESLNIYKIIDGEVFAGNRSEQNKVFQALEEAKKEEAKKARLSTFHWVKEDEEWVVAGDFSGKEVGSAITVVKANGEKQEKQITLFTSAGNAIVEDFVPSSSKEETETETVEVEVEVEVETSEVSEVSEVSEASEASEVEEIEEIEEKLRVLLGSQMTSYEIAKRSGIRVSMVDRYRTGESLIENITLKTAKKILKIINKNT